MLQPLGRVFSLSFQLFFCQSVGLVTQSSRFFKYFRGLGLAGGQGDPPQSFTEPHNSKNFKPHIKNREDRVTSPYNRDRVATVMEKSWIFWNFEIFWNFWKSHGILTKNGQGHGKVMDFLNCSKKSWKIMEFYKQILNSHELVPLCGSFSRSNCRVCWLRGHGILLYGHGRQFRGNPERATI